MCNFAIVENNRIVESQAIIGNHNFDLMVGFQCTHFLNVLGGRAKKL